MWLTALVAVLPMGLVPQFSSPESSEKKEKGWGEKFKIYLVIECGVWLPACYMFCYRFQPTIRFMASPAGRKVVERSGAFLQRWTPSWHASIAKLASKIEGAPVWRAFGEWALINKLMAPVGFPTKMWIAHKIVEARNADSRADVPLDVIGSRVKTR